jgi:hypothetical protein
MRVVLRRRARCQAGFGIDVLPFEDPDGIQLELTAPAADEG